MKLRKLPKKTRSTTSIVQQHDWQIPTWSWTYTRVIGKYLVLQCIYHSLVTLRRPVMPTITERRSAATGKHQDD